MNKTAVVLFSVWLVLGGVATVCVAEDDEAVLQMKALKALMDDLPDSTLPSVPKKMTEEVIKEDAVDSKALKTPTAEENKSTWYEGRDMKEPVMPVIQKDTTEDMIEAGSSEEQEDAVLPMDDDKIVDTKDVDMSEEVEEGAKAPKTMDEQESTIMDMINGDETTGQDKTEGPVPVAEKTKVPDTTAAVADEDMVEFREDLSDEISDNIVEINKRIEQMDGMLDQEIQDLESQIGNGPMPMDEEQTLPSEGAY